MLHQVRYAFINILREKEVLFWNLLFPIALATFMYMAFGNLYEKDLKFHAVPVAAIIEEENQYFSQLLDELSKGGEDQTLKLVKVKNENQAKEKLENGEIKGIYYIGKNVRLVVSEQGLEQTILNVILSQYQQISKVMTDTAMQRPDKMEAALNAIINDSAYYKEQSVSSGNQDVYTNYYYAIFAMSCLFASFSGVFQASQMQANTSSLGMRKCVTPYPKGRMIFVSFTSTLVIHFVYSVIAFVYMKFVLGIDFGAKIAAILLLLLVGNGAGIGIGMIIGSIYKLKEGNKIGIAVAFSMFLSVMADLVASGIKDAIEHTFPIFNRVNPAALIVDSFYALNVYDTYERYFRNIATLLGMTVALLIISFLLVRRNRYASL